MPTEDAGRPIRSEDLVRQKRETNERFAAADQASTEAFRRVNMAALALRAREPERPAETKPGAYVIYRQPIAGPGAERIGPFVTTRTTGRQLKIGERDLTGAGELDLLRPGAIWAQTSENRDEVFEARLEPARLVQFNEVMVPHIAGQVSIELFSDRGSEKIAALEQSRLLRFAETKSFNGRVRLRSVSGATAPDGTYIHAMGGLSIYNSDWAPTGEVRTEFQMPEDGDLTGVDARVWPTQDQPSSTIYVDGSQVALPTSLSKGDTVQVRMPRVQGGTPASLVELSLSIT